MRLMIAKLLNRNIAVDLQEDAVAIIHESATRTSPKETGGILLGWWDGHSIVISSAAEVVDRAATGNSWTRRQNEAQSTLDSIISNTENRNLGYVGDWHSHPAPVGASSMDLKSLIRASAQYQNPLALIVRLSNGSVRIYAASHGKLMNTYRI